MWSGTCCADSRDAGARPLTRASVTRTSATRDSDTRQRSTYISLSNACFICNKALSTTDRGQARFMRIKPSPPGPN